MKIVFFGTVTQFIQELKGTIQQSVTKDQSKDKGGKFLLTLMGTTKFLIVEFALGQEKS